MNCCVLGDTIATSLLIPEREPTKVMIALKSNLVNNKFIKVTVKRKVSENYCWNSTIKGDLKNNISCCSY